MFKNEGDAIILVGYIGEELGGSQFLKTCHGRKEGPPPQIDLELEIKVQTAVRDLIRGQLLKARTIAAKAGSPLRWRKAVLIPKNFLEQMWSSAKATDLPLQCFLTNHSRG